MSDRFALLLQRLPTARAQVLVMADLLGSRSDDRCFFASEIAPSFRALHVPPPANIPQVLSALAKAGLLLPHGAGQWSVTPEGRERLPELLAGVTSAAVAAQDKAGVPSAEFAHVQHTVIPSWAAPPRWQVGIARLLDVHPFETNVFCMTRFPSEGPTPDPVKKAIPVIRETLGSFGLTLLLADERIVDDDLFTNVGAYMWGSQYGLGIIEDRAGRGVNYNAVIELGGMIVTGRRCAILKDQPVKGLPTDLAGHIYRRVDLTKPATVKNAVKKWAAVDLGMSEAQAK